MQTAPFDLWSAGNVPNPRPLVTWSPPSSCERARAFPLPRRPPSRAAPTSVCLLCDTSRALRPSLSLGLAFAPPVVLFLRSFIMSEFCMTWWTAHSPKSLRNGMQRAGLCTLPGSAQEWGFGYGIGGRRWTSKPSPFPCDTFGSLAAYCFCCTLPRSRHCFLSSSSCRAPIPPCVFHLSFPWLNWRLRVCMNS